MCVDSILSFPSFHLSFWCVWCDTKSSNHPTSLSASPPVTFSSTENFSPSLRSPIIALLCGCVVGYLPPLYSTPPLPLMMKERMRLEREEATRLLEEETEVRHTSSAGCSDKLAVWAELQPQTPQKCHHSIFALKSSS